jgi:hypothetical protein
MASRLDLHHSFDELRVKLARPMSAPVETVPMICRGMFGFDPERSSINY